MFSNLLVKDKKAFTLTELVIVVGIIGILSADGVVAYNGYTASAKANATKTMHSQAVKYISAEIQKCSLGESKFMGTDQDCPATAAKAVTGAKNTMTDKNPFSTADNAVVSRSSFVAGQVSLSSSGSTVTVKTCTKSGCGSSDQLTATLTVD